MRIDASQPAATPVGGSKHARSKGGRARGTAGDDPIQEAAAGLWTVFDAAFSRTSARAEPAGDLRCTVAISSPLERRYRRTDARGETRSVAVSLLLSRMAGAVHGGALISTSRPYVSFFLAPVTRRGQLHWRVGTSGRLLTADLVADLFLSVLEDDAAATQHLAPLLAYSLG